MVILDGIKFTLRDLVMRINRRRIAGVVRSVFLIYMSGSRLEISS